MAFHCSTSSLARFASLELVHSDAVRCSTCWRVLGVLVCGLMAMSCTLTNDEYDPLRLESTEVVPISENDSVDDEEMGTVGSAGTGADARDAGSPSAEPGEGPPAVSGLDPTDCDPSMQECEPSSCEGAACQVDTDTCTDGILGAQESDVDCGGVCAPCEVGFTCEAGADCVSGVCVDASCAAPSCDDAVLNGAEADTDCGSACGVLCLSGASCESDADCASGLCQENQCAAASCGDGVLNGAETDVDCGGGECRLCATLASCAEGEDCGSGVCASFGCEAGSCCQPPRCTDGVQNGGETDVDCGGGCTGCSLGESCLADTDCDSGQCGFTRACLPAPTCTDGVRNGDEEGIDCGGTDSTCPACCSLDSSLDLGPRGTVVTISDNACTRIAQFPGYAPSYLESFTVGSFPVDVRWRQECTGASGAGTFFASYGQVPLEGATDACPISVQFRGTGTPLEMRWY